MIFAFIIIASLFTLPALYLIYTGVKVIRNMKTNDIEGKVSFHAYYVDGLIINRESIRNSQHWGVFCLQYLNGFGISFLTFVSLLIIRDYLLYKLIFSVFAGIAFNIFISRKSLTGNVINELHLKKTVDIMRYDKDILLNILINLSCNKDDQSKQEKEEILKDLINKYISSEMINNHDHKGLINKLHFSKRSLEIDIYQVLK